MLKTGELTRDGARRERRGETSLAGLFAPLALVSMVLLVALQLLMWYKAVDGRGGPDAYVRGIDFAPTLTGARIVRDGEGPRLYDLATQRAALEQVLAPYKTLPADTILPYLHPPFEALLIAPLLGLSYGTLYLLWSGLTLLAFVGSLALLARALPVAGRPRWFLVAALCSYQAIYQVLWLGQSSPLVTLGLCGSFLALKRGRPGWAGVALALVAIKPQMLLVTGPVLLLMGRWRALASCAAVLAGASVLAMPILGPLWPLHYLRFLSAINGWAGNKYIYPVIMHNWRGLATNLLGGVAPGLVGPAVTLLTLVAAVVLLGAWWRARSEVTGAAWGEQSDLLWALGCLLAVLVAPHLYMADLTSLALPVWIVVAGLASGAWRGPLARLWLGILWAIYMVGFLLPTIAGEWPAAPVVPAVLLFAIAAALLAWRIAGLSSALAPRRPNSAPFGSAATISRRS
jgi:hypothetical protein